jgi:hypothetical protein
VVRSDARAAPTRRRRRTHRLVLRRRAVHAVDAVRGRARRRNAPRKDELAARRLAVDLALVGHVDERHRRRLGRRAARRLARVDEILQALAAQRPRAQPQHKADGLREGEQEGRGDGVARAHARTWRRGAAAAACARELRVARTSIRFDLPAPLGPMIAVKPPNGPIVCLPPQLLKFTVSRRSMRPIAAAAAAAAAG